MPFKFNPLSGEFDLVIPATAGDTGDVGDTGVDGNKGDTGDQGDTGVG